MGTLFSGIVGVAILALAIAWVLLPVLIYSKMNEAIQVLRDMRGELMRMRKYYEPDLPQPTQLMPRDPDRIR